MSWHDHFSIDLTSQFVTRVSLAAVNAFSAVAALRSRGCLNGQYGPHVLFVAFWSVMTTIGMLALAFDLPLAFVIEGLNIAAICAIGGWGSLIWRFTNKARKEWRLVEQLELVRLRQGEMRELAKMIDVENPSLADVVRLRGVILSTTDPKNAAL